MLLEEYLSVSFGADLYQKWSLSTSNFLINWYDLTSDLKLGKEIKNVFFFIIFFFEMKEKEEGSVTYVSI